MNKLHCCRSTINTTADWSRLDANTGEIVPRRKKQQDDELTDQDMVVQLTPNQVVAYNLAQARMWKNWTQAEAAEQLEPFLGARWSKATFSSAERSVDGQRVRQFTAD